MHTVAVLAQAIPQSPDNVIAPTCVAELLTPIQHKSFSVMGAYIPKPVTLAGFPFSLKDLHYEEVQLFDALIQKVVSERNVPGQEERPFKSVLTTLSTMTNMSVSQLVGKYNSMVAPASTPLEALQCMHEILPTPTETERRGAGKQRTNLKRLRGEDAQWHGSEKKRRFVPLQAQKNNRKRSARHLCGDRRQHCRQRQARPTGQPTKHRSGDKTGWVWRRGIWYYDRPTWLQLAGRRQYTD